MTHFKIEAFNWRCHIADLLTRSDTLTRVTLSDSGLKFWDAMYIIDVIFSNQLSLTASLSSDVVDDLSLYSNSIPTLLDQYGWSLFIKKV